MSEELKVDVLLVLYAKPRGVALTDFPRAFQELHGRALDLSRFGSSVGHLADAMVELVERRVAGGREKLFARGFGPSHGHPSGASGPAPCGGRLNRLQMPEPDGPAPIPARPPAPAAALGPGPRPAPSGSLPRGPGRERAPDRACRNGPEAACLGRWPPAQLFSLPAVPQIQAAPFPKYMQPILLLPANPSGRGQAQWLPVLLQDPAACLIQPPDWQALKPRPLPSTAGRAVQSTGGQRQAKRPEAPSGPRASPQPQAVGPAHRKAGEGGQALTYSQVLRSSVEGRQRESAAGGGQALRATGPTRSPVLDSEEWPDPASCRRTGAVPRAWAAGGQSPGLAEGRGRTQRMRSPSVEPARANGEQTRADAKMGDAVSWCHDPAPAAPSSSSGGRSSERGPPESRCGGDETQARRTPETGPGTASGAVDTPPLPPSIGPGPPRPQEPETAQQVRENLARLVQQHPGGLSVFELQRAYAKIYQRPLIPPAYSSIKELLHHIPDCVSLEGLGVQTRIYPCSTAEASPGVLQQHTMNDTEQGAIGISLRTAKKERATGTGASACRNTDPAGTETVATENRVMEPGVAGPAASGRALASPPSTPSSPRRPPAPAHHCPGLSLAPTPQLGPALPLPSYPEAQWPRPRPAFNPRAQAAAFPQASGSWVPGIRRDSPRPALRQSLSPGHSPRAWASPAPVSQGLRVEHNGGPFARPAAHSGAGSLASPGLGSPWRAGLAYTPPQVLPRGPRSPSPAYYTPYLEDEQKICALL